MWGRSDRTVPEDSSYERFYKTRLSRCGGASCQPCGDPGTRLVFEYSTQGVYDCHLHIISLSLNGRGKSPVVDFVEPMRRRQVVAVPEVRRRVWVSRCVRQMLYADSAYYSWHLSVSQKKKKYLTFVCSLLEAMPPACCSGWQRRGRFCSNVTCAIKEGNSLRHSLVSPVIPRRTFPRSLQKV